MQIELITIKDSLFNCDVTATHVIRSLSSELSHYMEQISARVRILRRIRDQTESAHWTGTTPKSTNAASLATAVPPRTMRDPPSNETVRASSTAPTMWNPELNSKKNRPWTPSPDLERQFFSFYVLLRMSTEELPARNTKVYGLKART